MEVFSVILYVVFCVVCYFLGYTQGAKHELKRSLKMLSDLKTALDQVQADALALSKKGVPDGNKN